MTAKFTQSDEFLISVIHSVITCPVTKQVTEEGKKDDILTKNKQFLVMCDKATLYGAQKVLE